MPSVNPYQSPRTNSPPAPPDVRPVHAYRAIAAAIGGLAFGALVWGLSPLLTGKNEPWDVHSYYTTAMLAGGFILGFACPRQFWAPALGIYAGQVFYLHARIPGAVVPPFISVALFGFPLAILGSGVAYSVSTIVRRCIRCHQPPQ